MLFLAPILAQVATLGVADRTEARYTVADGLNYGSAVTRPSAGLALGWKHLNLTLGYGPAITVQPLEETPRYLYVFHSASASGTYSWGRTQLIVTEASGYGSQNFRTLALNGLGNAGTTNPQQPATGSPTPVGTPISPVGSPTTPGGSPSAPGGVGTPQGTNQGLATDRKIHFITSTTSVAVTHRVSGSTTVTGELAYAIAGATRASDKDVFPIVRGPRALGAVRYRMGHADDLSLAVSAQYASSSIGSSVWLGTATGSWSHHFSLKTVGTAGAGVGGTRTPLVQDFVAYSIYPVLTASIAHASLLARGNLNFGFTASSTPVIDPTTAAADPRVGLGAALGWGRDKFSASLSGNSALSTAAANSKGSLTAAGGSAGVAYAFGKGVSADSGVRLAYQAFQGRTVLPVSYLVFVGVTFGVQTPL